MGRDQSGSEKERKILLFLYDVTKHKSFEAITFIISRLHCTSFPFSPTIFFLVSGFKTSLLNLHTTSVCTQVGHVPKFCMGGAMYQ